jgi:hypothetical protein
MIVAPDPEEAGYFVLAQSKNNLGPSPPSLRYRIVDAEDAPIVRWAGESTYTADSLMESGGADERGDRSEAKEFLRAELSQGRRRRADLVAAARRLGITDRTLRRAKRDLEIRSEKEGFAPSEWFWALPTVQMAKAANE